MRSIKPLPEAVHSSLRSGSVLSDFGRVVEELVFNSLDAGATKVSAAVGVGTCYIKVADNGCGITRDGLVLLGERYATSKFEHLLDINTANGSFGFRGEALGSISDVSVLEILTKVQGMPNGYRKVIKGCKCLHLGIDDHRREVGTTVIVRDLFYNQPVRRKHIQSSPMRILHSVRENVLRIALVYPTVSFKVIDVDRGEELLYSYPSQNPLPLLKSCYGIEFSSSLHELEVSDGVLKLSGYLSSPNETFSLKAFQYFYVNSRFISKGPIHKLLNQLAASFSSADPMKADMLPQNGKRSRSQISPTYILNLSCPQGHYDVTFEPSKTSVVFKDWNTICGFIDKAVSRFWSPALSNDAVKVESLSAVADMSEKAALWDETDNSLSTAEDTKVNKGILKKRRLTRSPQGSPDLFSNEIKMQAEKSMQMSNFTNNGTPSAISRKKTVHFEEEGNSFLKSSDRLPWQFRASAPEVNDGPLGVPICDVSFAEDFYFENKLARGGSSEELGNQSFSTWEGPSREIESVDNYGVKIGEFSYCSETVNGVKKAGRDSWKPFLRSCSARESLQQDGTCFTDKGFLFEAGVGTRSKWLDSLDAVRTVEVDNINKVIFSKNCLGSPSLLREFSDREGCLLPEFLPIRELGSSDWSALTSRMDFLHESAGTKHIVNEDGFAQSFKYSTGFELSADAMKDGIFICDNCKGGRAEFLGDSILSPKCPDSFRDETQWASFDFFHNEDELASSYTPSASLVDSVKNRPVHIRYHEKMSGCRRKLRRSHSAPPFYRGKKKFLAINNSETLQTDTFHPEAIREPCTLQEYAKLNQIQESPLVMRSSKEGSPNDLLCTARQDLKRIPDVVETQNFGIQKDQWLHTCNSNLDFMLKETQETSDIVNKWRDGYPRNTSGDKSDKLHCQDSVLDISSGILHLSGDSLVPASISKNFLANAKVLQQVDRKFIPVVSGGTIAIIDQHAADERIRLEELRKKVLSGEMRTITYLDAEQELVLPEIGYQLLHNYSDEIQKWGWICNFHTQSSMSFKKNLNLLRSQSSSAKLLAVPCILGVNLTDMDLLEFLQQLADTDGSSMIPSAVLRVLNFKACRGAIMFGDRLLPSECSLLVEELKLTSLCFQCAHGRPTTVPLVNLEILRKQVVKLQMWNSCSAELFHGLNRHKPSLARAAERLNSA